MPAGNQMRVREVVRAIVLAAFCVSSMHPLAYDKAHDGDHMHEWLPSLGQVTEWTTRAGSPVDVGADIFLHTPIASDS